LKFQSLFEFKIPTDQTRLLQEWTKDFKNLAKDVTNLRFTPFQALAFSKLRTITKYDQFYKRDGSIAQNLRTQDGSIITDKDQVSKLIIESLKNIDKHLIQKQPHMTKELPELPPITEEELQKTLKHISTKKALTKFPVPDELIHLIPSNKLSTFFSEIWNPNFIETFPELFDCKLIPLNKIHPRIPNCDQISPIVATNVIFKIIEARFNDELQEKFWKLEGCSYSQFGFLKNMNSQSQIFNLLHQTILKWTKFPNSRH